MDVNLLFATTEPTNPNALAIILVITVTIAIAWLIKRYDKTPLPMPFIVEQYLKGRAERAEIKTAKIGADNEIRFDVKESVLHRGSRQLKIPEGAIEHFVCKLIFANPEEYQSDVDILYEAREEESANQRTVYFAVSRVNNKARQKLGLKDDLLKRGKERTVLNKIYRIHH